MRFLSHRPKTLTKRYLNARIFVSSEFVPVWGHNYVYIASLTWKWFPCRIKILTPNSNGGLINSSRCWTRTVYLIGDLWTDEIHLYSYPLLSKLMFERKVIIDIEYALSISLSFSFWLFDSLLCVLFLHVLVLSCSLSIGFSSLSFLHLSLSCHLC